VTTKIVDGRTPIPLSSYGDQLEYTAYTSTVYGQQGTIATFNTTVSDEFESVDVTIGKLNISISSDFTISAGVNNAGFEIRGSIISPNILSKTVGSSYSIDGRTSYGQELKFTAGGGTYATVAVTTGLILAPEITLPILWRMAQVSY
jgi:hypothetical protein